MSVLLPNRFTAALRLTDRLWHLRGHDGTLLALNRGGLPIGSVLARLLGFPLELLPEAKPATWTAPASEITPVALERYKAQQCQLLTNTASKQAGKTLILIDDGRTTEEGLATALQAARARQPDLLVMALPSAEPAMAARLRALADALVCSMLSSSHPTLPCGPYEPLPPVTDEEVEEAMRAVMA